jgi:hypothetical protein
MLSSARLFLFLVLLLWSFLSLLLVISPFHHIATSYRHIIPTYNTAISPYRHTTIPPRQSSSACHLHLLLTPSQVSFSSARQAAAASPQVIKLVYIAVSVLCFVRHHLAIRPPPSIVHPPGCLQSLFVNNLGLALGS